MLGFRVDSNPSLPWHVSIIDADPGLQDLLLWLQYTNTYGLQKYCGGKGAVWPLSKLERGPPDPPPGQAFIVFLGTLHRG